MLVLTQGQSAEKIIVTLTELQTLLEPYYLFQFIHVLTKNIVTVIRSLDEDESEYPERYNQFEINTAYVFTNQPRGEWHYWVYEQASETNTDPALSTALLETGKLLLQPSTEFGFDQYDKPVTYKTYNG
ncbi:MAG: hypothetical protein ACTHMC_01420 [Pseudobacter sp.]|uniref:hypothetical protein n=1 Tax=Pseudobacter sp. TaxID=2045420 RepID=UPI003F81262D